MKSRALKNSIYAGIDLLTFNRGIARAINGFTIRFPARWSKYFESDYEKENTRFLKEYCKPGMQTVDVGAHLGLMSVICGRLTGKTGKVYAFEPTPGTFSVLKKIIALNGLEDVVVPLNMAVSKQSGEVDFYVDGENEGSNANSLLAKHHQKRQAIRIQTMSLDDFIRARNIQQLDLIKIDAEGMELDVLIGAEESIRRFKPKIILAIHPSLVKNNGQSVEEIFRAIERFAIYNIVYNGQILSEAGFCSITDFFDVHLIPK